MSGRHRVRNGVSNRPWLTAGIGVAVLGLIAASAALVVSRSGPSSAGSTSSPAGHPTLSLVSSDPAPGSTGVAPDALLALHFSSALSSAGTEPTLNPPVAGT